MAVTGVRAAPVLLERLLQVLVSSHELGFEVRGLLVGLDGVGLSFGEVAEDPVAHGLSFVRGPLGPLGGLGFVLRHAEPARVVKGDDAHGAGVAILRGLVHPGEGGQGVVLDLQVGRGVDGVAQREDVLGLGVLGLGEREQFGLRRVGPELADVAVMDLAGQLGDRHFPLVREVDYEDRAEGGTDEVGFQPDELAAHGLIQTPACSEARD